MILGLTGRYCAGKNLAASLLEQRGFVLIDVDKVGHQVLIQETDRVLAAFGDGISDGAGGIDRRKLGQIVFSDPAALQTLEGIVHPEMVAQVRQITQKHNRVVINAAILFKMGLHRLCSTVIWVEAPFFVRFLRAKKRDRLSFYEVWQRFRSQSKNTLRPRQNYVDIKVVRNSGKVHYLSRQLERIVNRLDDGGSS